MIHSGTCLGGVLLFLHSVNLLNSPVDPMDTTFARYRTPWRLEEPDRCLGSGRRARYRYLPHSITAVFAQGAVQHSQIHSKFEDSQE